jgi:outer membrane protein assembly factor BamD (BamD/ComL family)
MKNNDNKFKYIIVAVVAVIVITAGTVGVLVLLNNNANTNSKTDKSKVPVTEATATSLWTQALAAVDSKDIAKAKTLLQEAKQQYTELKDNDGLANTEAELYYVSNYKAPIPEKTITKYASDLKL